MPKYLEFKKDIQRRTLTLTLTDEGKEWLDSVEEDRSEDEIVLDLMEHQLCNGWINLRPEQIGALTSSPFLLCEDYECDEDGKLLDVGSIYWFANYEASSELSCLRQNGLVLQEFARDDAPTYPLMTDFKIPNIDGMDVDDLEHAAVALRLLATYAETLRSAKSYRLQECPNQAGIAEKKCEEIYNQLPKSLRW